MAYFAAVRQHPDATHSGPSYFQLNNSDGSQAANRYLFLNDRSQCDRGWKSFLHGHYRHKM